MQAKNETFRDFLKRTDNLAIHLNVNVQDLPEVVGISRASLFSYRTGNRPLTSKAWRKLEAAEKAAGLGISAPPPDQAAPETEPDAQFLDELRRVNARLDKIEGALSALAREIRRR